MASRAGGERAPHPRARHGHGGLRGAPRRVDGTRAGGGAPGLKGLGLPDGAPRAPGCRGCATPCRPTPVTAQAGRAAWIDAGPGSRPEAPNAAPRGATGRTAGRARGRGFPLGRRARAGVARPTQPADRRARAGTAGREQAAGADCHDAVRQARREEPAEKLDDVQGRRAQAGPAHVPGGARDGAVRAADETVGGAGALEDRGGEGGAGGVAVGVGLTVDIAGAGPALGGAVLQQTVRPGGFAARAGEGGEGVDRAQAVGAGGPPGRTVCCEATTGHHGMHGRVVRELPAPGVPDPGAPREVRPEATLVGGEPLASVSRGVEHGVRREALRGAEEGAEGLRDGAGEEAVRPRELCVQVRRSPLVGGRLLTLGAGAVATGMMDAVAPAPVLALRAAGAVVSAVARVEGAAALAGGGGKRRSARQIRRGAGGAARAQGGQGSRPCLRAWRRAEASAGPWWGRGRERLVVARWGGPRERWRRRGVTPAARRGVAAACRRGGRAPPSVVLPARCCAVRQAPCTLARRRGKAAGGLWGMGARISCGS